MTRPITPTLDRVAGPADLKALSDAELDGLPMNCGPRSSRPCPRQAGIWDRRWAWWN